MADGSRHGLRMVKEAAYGVTPDTPEFETIRHTGTTIGLSKGTLESAELRDDRQRSDVRHGAKAVGGDISVENSFGSHDSIFEAVLCGSWVGDVLKAGTLRRSFTVERYFADLAAEKKPFHRFTGVEFNTMALSVPANAIITSKFGVVGKGLTTASAIVAGATYPAPTTTAPLDSFTGTLNEDGAPIAVITEITLNLDNGLDPRYVVGSSETILPSIGQSSVAGQITAYFEDSILLDKFINEEESSIEFNLPDGAGNNLKWTLPRVKYMGGQPDVAGPGPITLAMPFSALFDVGAGSNIVLTRTPA